MRDEKTKRDRDQCNLKSSVIIMLAMRTAVEASMPKSNPNNPPEIQGNPKASLYEQCREERIKENLQRMQNLGILNLARKLQSETRPGKRSFGNSYPAPKSTPPTAPSRRSSRFNLFFLSD